MPWDKIYLLTLQLEAQERELKELKEERGHRWFLLDLAQTQWG
jgi:hypothetical protein